MTGVETPDIQDPEDQQYQALKAALKRKITAKLAARKAQAEAPTGPRTSGIDLNWDVPPSADMAGRVATAGAAARAGILSAAESPMSLARSVPQAIGHQTGHAAGVIERLATDSGPAGLVGKGLSALGLPEALRWISGSAKEGAQVTAEGLASKAEGLVTGETPEQVSARYRDIEQKAVDEHGPVAQLGFGVTRAIGSLAGFIYGGPGKIISAVDAPFYAAGQAAVGRSALGLAERAGLSAQRIAEAQKAGTLFKDLVAATAGSTKVRAATLSMMNRFGLKGATAAAGFGAAGLAATHDPNETEEARVARAGVEAALSPIYLILGKVGQKVEGPVAGWLSGKTPWNANVGAALGGLVEGAGFAQLDVETFKEGVRGAWLMANGQTKEGGDLLESWLTKTMASAIGFGFVKGMKPSAVPEFMRANPEVGRAPWSVFEESPAGQELRDNRAITARKTRDAAPLQAGLEAMDLSARMSRLGWKEVGSQGEWREVRIPAFQGSMLVKNDGGPQVQVRGPLIELLGFEADKTYTGPEAARAIKQVAVATALNHLRGRSVLGTEPGLVEVDPLSAIYQGDGFRYAYRFGQVYRQADAEAGAPWVVDAEKTARAAKRLEPQTEPGIALRDPELADSFADFTNYLDAYAEQHGKDADREVGARALNVVADEIARATSEDFAANPGLRDWLKTFKDPAHVGELFAKRGEDQFLDLMETIAGTRSEVTRGKEAEAKEEAPDVPKPAAGDAGALALPEAADYGKPRRATQAEIDAKAEALRRSGRLVSLMYDGPHPKWVAEAKSGGRTTLIWGYTPKEVAFQIREHQKATAGGEDVLASPSNHHDALKRAAPGWLVGGPGRKFFEKWATGEMTDEQVVKELLRPYADSAEERSGRARKDFIQESGTGQREAYVEEIGAFADASRQSHREALGQIAEAAVEELRAARREAREMEFPSNQPQPMPMGGTSDFKVRRTQIREKLEEVGGAPIYSGDVNKKGMAGFYRLDTEFIRSKGAQDIATQAHEFGHHMHKQMTGDVHRSLGPKIDAELDAMGRNLYGAKVPAQGHYRAEGVAEWFARDFLGDSTLRQSAPEFTIFAEQRLREMGKAEGIAEIRKMFKDWSDQGAIARVRSSIAMHGDKDEAGFARKLFEAAKASPMAYRRALVDEMAPVRDMVRGIAKRKGKHASELDPEKNPHLVYEALAMGARGTAEQFIYRAAVDTHGNRVGPSLRERLRAIDKKEVNDFLAFAAASRALSKYYPNKMDPGFAEADAQHTWQTLQNPRFIRAVEAITQWGDLLMDYMVDAGGMTKEQAKEIRDVNPVWIPFYRDPEQLAGGFEKTMTRHAGKGVVNKGTGIRKVKGADMQIGDLFSNLMEHAVSVITRANQMRVARAFAEAIESDPGAASSFHAVKLDNAFEAQARHEKGDPVVSIKRGGETEWWEFKDEQVFRSLLGLDKDIIGASAGAWLRFAHGATRAVRLGAVGLNPGFSLAQIAMDEIVAYVKSSDIIPFQRHIKGFKLWFPDLMKRAFTGQGTEFMERVRALGLDQASNWLGDGLRAHRVRQRELFARTPGDKIKSILLHPLEAAEKLLSVQNLLPRLPAFKERYEAELKRGTSEQGAMLLAMRDYKEATINFGKFGLVSRFANMIEPFFNVRFQAPADLVRTLSGTSQGRAHAAQAWAKLTVGMTGLTMLAWYWNKDDPDYQDLPVETRLKYWALKIPGTKTFFYLRKPPGYADLFANAPEAVAEIINRKDEKLVKDTMSKFIGEMLPPAKDMPFGLIALLTPQVIQPIVEAATNRDFTFGTEIESKAEQRLPETERAGKRTTELGKDIAKGLGVSPKDFEHVLRNYTGGAGLEMLRIVDHALGGTEQKRETLSDVPFVGRFFSRDDSRVVNEFYDERRILEEKHHAHTDTPAEKAQYFMLRAAAEQITKLRHGAKAGAVDEETLSRLQREIATAAMARLRAMR